METQKLEIAAEIVIERCKAEIGNVEVRSRYRNWKDRSEIGKVEVRSRERNYKFNIGEGEKMKCLPRENWMF